MLAFYIWEQRSLADQMQQRVELHLIGQFTT